MAVGLARLHSQHRVEEEDALPGPVDEAAVLSGRQTQIGLPLPVDVCQRGRQLDAGGHRKGQAVGLPRPVIGVLAQNHHLHLVRGRQREGGKQVRPGREDRRFCVGPVHPRHQRGEGRRGKTGLQARLPGAQNG